MSEKVAKSLMSDLLDFEDRWKRAKLSVRAQKKAGVLDASVSDDIRVERSLWYKAAKRQLRQSLKVVQFKGEIIRTINKYGEPTKVLTLQRESGIGEQSPYLQPFLQALRELEVEMVIKVEREAGTAHTAAKDAYLREDGTMERVVPTDLTPSHGFSGAVCAGCIVTLLADVNIVESVSK